MLKGSSGHSWMTHPGQLHPHPPSAHRLSRGLEWVEVRWEEEGNGGWEDGGGGKQEAGGEDAALAYAHRFDGWPLGTSPVVTPAMIEEQTSYLPQQVIAACRVYAARVSVIPHHFAFVRMALLLEGEGRRALSARPRGTIRQGAARERERV